MLCSFEKCHRYATSNSDRRKCYYGEPRCWKGWLDIFSNLFKSNFDQDRRKPIAVRVRTNHIVRR